MARAGDAQDAERGAVAIEHRERSLREGRP